MPVSERLLVVSSFSAVALFNLGWCDDLSGYRVSDTHANPVGVKTDAPWEVIWDVMRCWIKEHPVKPHAPESYAGRILAKEPKLTANFARANGAISKSRLQGVTRFAQNPEGWGPKARAGRNVDGNKKGGGDKASGARDGARASRQPVMTRVPDLMLQRKREGDGEEDDDSKRPKSG